MIVVTKRYESVRVWKMFERLWTTLADLVTDMKKNGVVVPEDAMKSLRCCKSFITHYRSHLGNPMECDSPECRKVLSNIVSDMTNLESYLILICVNKLGEKYAEEWSKKLMAARLGEESGS